MSPRHPRTYAFLLLVIGSLGPIGGALYSQYMLGFPPCPLCLWQRYPYILPTVSALVLSWHIWIPATSGVAVAFNEMRISRWKPWLILGMLGWLITAGIAAYHSAFELGWVEGAAGCAAASANGSLADLREAILHAPLVACNVVSLRFLGLSMAAWNLIGALTFVALGIILLLRNRSDDRAFASR